MRTPGINTRLLHTPYSKNDPHGALQVPLYATSSFEFACSDDIEGAFRGTKPAHAYSRSGNPTVEMLEMRLKSVTNAQGAVAFASGMAAISAVVSAICQAGDNVVTTKKLFGNTYALFENNFKPFGIEFRYADFANPESIEALIDGNTRMLFFETLNNPQLEVPNFELIAQIANKHNVLLCSDTTLTPPCVFNAGAQGIHIEVLSSTKYVSSGAATLGGIVVVHGNYNWQLVPALKTWFDKFNDLAFFARLKKDVLRNMGACMSPFNAYMQLVGIETMALRFNRMTENATAVSKWLLQHPKVKNVNYPGIDNGANFALAKKYFSLAGGLLTFDLHSRQQCYVFMDALNIVRRATNLNDNKSLIIHPASTIFSEYPANIIAEMGVPDTLMRFSVGIEDIEDIIADLAQALDKI